ncbi:MAG: hypothetical protein U1E26_04430 [Coriobacteriia bacterium]|nr:hypothetical protein [Coriobacteriia bacterium]
MIARKHVRAIALVLAFLLIASLLIACEPRSADPGTDSAARSEELTPGEFPDKEPPAPVEPPPPMLRNPETAVFSYLLWITFAYRVLNSDVATHAFDEWEEVRVNSYVELNRQESRAIDQRLLKFEPRAVETKGDTATVSAREEWVYRYISTGDGTYSTPRHEATYDTTYTVVNVQDKGWLVHKVEATPIGDTPK